MNQIEFHADKSTGASNAKHLHLRKSGSMLTGVCSGIAEYLNVDVQLLRLGAVVLALVSGWTLPAYLAAAFILPLEEDSDAAGGARPLIDGQKVIKQIKLSARQLLSAAAMKDGGAFKHQWEAQVGNLRRAWMDAVQG